MRRLIVDPAAPDAEVVSEAAGVLRAGGLVAFPTETVYGLGAHALDPVAVQRIYDAKERPRFNPLIVHLPDAAQARSLAATWPRAAETLARHFWPGPLTLVVTKVAAVPDVVTASLPTVGLRVPSHPVAQALLRAAELPVAAPSANPYMRVSPTTGVHVLEGLGDRVDLLLDAGPTPLGIESTVVDVSSDPPRLLRPGSIGRRDIEAVIGLLGAAPEPSGDAPRSSPGQLRRHYAPAARVLAFDARRAPQARQAVLDARRRGERTGALLLGQFDAPLDEPMQMPGDPDRYAKALYAALHRLDALGCALILIEHVPPGDAWAGVRDRIARASEPD